jgi:hypothetical protein
MVVRLDRSKQSSCNKIWLKRMRKLSPLGSEWWQPIVVATTGGFHMKLLHTANPSSCDPSQHDIETFESDGFL